MLPHLTLAVDANVQRVGVASGAVDDCRGALGVEVIALCQAVQRAGLHTTWSTGRAQTSNTSLSPAGPEHSGTQTLDVVPGLAASS